MNPGRLFSNCCDKLIKQMRYDGVPIRRSNTGFQRLPVDDGGNHNTECTTNDEASQSVCKKCDMEVLKDSGRFGKNMAADVSQKNAEMSQAKNICRNVSYDMWGISGVCTLALTVAKISSHYDRFAVSVPPGSLLLFDLA